VITPSSRTLRNRAIQNNAQERSTPVLSKALACAYILNSIPDKDRGLDFNSEATLYGDPTSYQEAMSGPYREQ